MAPSLSRTLLLLLFVLLYQLLQVLSLSLELYFGSIPQSARRSFQMNWNIFILVIASGQAFGEVFEFLFDSLESTNSETEARTLSLCGVLAFIPTYASLSGNFIAWPSSSCLKF
jgi:hypothetical protein